MRAGKSGRKSECDSITKEKETEETGAVKGTDEKTEKGTEKEQDEEADKKQDGEAEAVAAGMEKLKVGEAAGDSSSGGTGVGTSDEASDSKN